MSSCFYKKKQKKLNQEGAAPCAPKSSVALVPQSSTIAPSGLFRYPQCGGCTPTTPPPPYKNTGSLRFHTEMHFLEFLCEKNVSPYTKNIWKLVFFHIRIPFSRFLCENLSPKQAKSCSYIPAAPFFFTQKYPFLSFCMKNLGSSDQKLTVSTNFFP